MLDTAPADVNPRFSPVSGSARYRRRILLQDGASIGPRRVPDSFCDLTALVCLLPDFGRRAQPGIMDRSLGPAAGYMSKSERSGINRRSFLKSAVTGVTAEAATGAAAATNPR